MLRAVFDHSARRFARKTTISRVGSSVQTCYQRTKTDNAGDQIPESIESHSGIHYRPPLVGFLSVEIQASIALASSALPYWPGCCAKAVGESVRTAADAAAIINVRNIAFLPVRTCSAAANGHAKCRG